MQLGSSPSSRLHVAEGGIDGTLLISSSCKEPLVEDEALDVELANGDIALPPLAKGRVAGGLI